MSTWFANRKKRGEKYLIQTKLRLLQMCSLVKSKKKKKESRPLDDFLPSMNSRSNSKVARVARDTKVTNHDCNQHVEVIRQSRALLEVKNYIQCRL